MWSEVLPQTNLIQPGISPGAIQQNWISWSCMPATAWEKQLTVKQPWGGKGGLKIQSHIPTLSLDYKMWSPNSSAPPPPPVFVF